MLIENYYEKIKEFKKLAKKEDMFGKWSMQPHTPEEIMIAEIVNLESEADSPLVCASYYCLATAFEEKDVDNLLYINSGLFTYDGWDDEVVEFVVNLLMKGDRVNVYSEISEVLEKKKFNPFFRAKCKELCENAMKTKTNALKTRRDNLNSSINRLYQKALDMGEDIKEGKGIDRYSLEVKNMRTYVKERLEGFEREIVKLEDLSIKLNERLNWKGLMSTSNLSAEYLERRKPLWENEENTHR